MMLLVYLIYFTKREKKMYGFLALYAESEERLTW